MKNTTIGVDSSVSAIPATITLPSDPTASKCPYCDGKGERIRKVPHPNNVAEDIEAKVKCELCHGTGSMVINSLPTPGNVMIESVEAYLSILLTTFLALTDTAIPNKDQNKAFKHLFRKALDQQFVHMHNLAYLEDTGKGYKGCTPADYLIKPQT